MQPCPSQCPWQRRTHSLAIAGLFSLSLPCSLAKGLLLATNLLKGHFPLCCFFPAFLSVSDSSCVGSSCPAGEFNSLISAGGAQTWKISTRGNFNFTLWGALPQPHGHKESRSAMVFRKSGGGEISGNSSSWSTQSDSSTLSGSGSDSGSRFDNSTYIAGGNRRRLLQQTGAGGGNHAASSEDFESEDLVRLELLGDSLHVLVRDCRSSSGLKYTVVLAPLGQVWESQPFTVSIGLGRVALFWGPQGGCSGGSGNGSGSGIGNCSPLEIIEHHHWRATPSEPELQSVVPGASCDQPESVCAQCAAGSSKRDVGPGACGQCPAGQFAAEPGATECLACFLFSTSSPGSDHCTCAKNMYGETCEKGCVDGKCSGNGRCSMEGDCLCYDGFGGDDCSVPVCTAKDCDAGECHGNMVLHADGNLTKCPSGEYGCGEGFFGDDCSINEMTAEFGRTDMDGDMECFLNFEGRECAQCAMWFYGEHCTSFCKSATTCTGRGYCGHDGSCACLPGFKGSTCDECAEGFYGQRCSDVCDTHTKCSGTGRCDINGLCICDEGFAGDNCEFCF